MPLIDRNATLVKSFKAGDAPFSQLTVDHGGCRATLAGVQLALCAAGAVTGTVRLPQCFVELAGEDVWAGPWNSAWLASGTGRVVWAVTRTADRQPNHRHRIVLPAGRPVCLTTGGRLVAHRRREQPHDAQASSGMPTKLAGS